MNNHSSHLVIISGRSGSGKTLALRELEDLGFYCVDNLPVTLIKPLLDCTLGLENSDCQRLAVAIDVRNIASDLVPVSDLIHQLRSENNCKVTVIYLDALDKILLQRFKETRRVPPLKSVNEDFHSAIRCETPVLAPLREVADQEVDTTDETVAQLRSRIRKLFDTDNSQTMTLELVSFGFKQGVPTDADMMFDVRCLPNPFWEPQLRALTGFDAAVVEFLDRQPETASLTADLANLLRRWIPAFVNANRLYLTSAIGCTGGCHRSVYLCNRLRNELQDLDVQIHVRHRDLERNEHKAPTA